MKRAKSSSPKIEISSEELPDIGAGVFTLRKLARGTVKFTDYASLNIITDPDKIRKFEETGYKKINWFRSDLYSEIDIDNGYSKIYGGVLDDAGLFNGKKVVGELQKVYGRGGWKFNL